MNGRRESGCGTGIEVLSVIRLNRYYEGKTKALVLSYDDGRIYDRRMVETLDKYGIKATFHLNAGNLGMEGHLRPEEVNGLYRNHEIAAHTYSHPHMLQITEEQRLMELWRDRERLEEISGNIVDGFSYPYGEYDEKLKQITEAFGFSYARSIESQYDFQLPKDFYAWHPTCHHRENCVELAKKYLDYDYREGLSVFLLWGHGHNFEREGNWDILDQFCKLMGNRDDIWYCTMGEFARYVRGLGALKTSVRGTLMYNPTDQRLWLERNGKLVSIGPGERKMTEELL